MSIGKQYIMVLDWMQDELGLTGNDVLAYALIYGFSQDGESEFKGSAQYIADRLHIRKHTVLDILKRLASRNLIIKREFEYKGVRYCFYRADLSAAPPGAETAPPPWCGNRTTPGAETAPSNNVNNKINNKSPLTPQGEGTRPEGISDELWATVQQWLLYKQERRQGYRPQGLNAFLGTVRNRARDYGDAAVIRVIQDSMASGYQGVTWDRLTKQQPQQQREEEYW